MSPRLAVQLAAFAALFSANPGPAQEPPAFDASVDRPAYPPGAADRPRVLFDAAHNNTHLPDGNYRALVELLRNDGYDIDVATAAFDPAMLAPYDILVIATPQPFPDSLVNWSDASITRASWTNPALTEEECDAIQAWVQSGGALLLLTGHAPRAFWAAPLAGRFGVDVHNSYTADSLNSHRPHDTVPRGAWIVYSRENGLLGDHPITNGRNPGERLRGIRVNGSASLSGPPGSRAFLRLGESAYEWIFHDFAFWDDARYTEVSAAGRAQGVALRHGAGRVVVLAPTAPFSEAYLARAETDDRQLALNVLHWLSGLTGPAPIPDGDALLVGADALDLPLLPSPVPVRYSVGYGSRALELQRGARALGGLLADSLDVPAVDLSLFVLDGADWAALMELPYGLHTLLDDEPVFVAPARRDTGIYYDSSLPPAEAELRVDLTGLHYLAHFYAAAALHADGHADGPRLEWLDELATLLLEKRLREAMDPALAELGRRSETEALQLDEPRITDLSGFDREYRRYFVTAEGAPNYAWFLARLSRWADGIHDDHGVGALRLLGRALQGAPAPVTTEGVLAILGKLGLAVPPWARTEASASG